MSASVAMNAINMPPSPPLSPQFPLQPPSDSPISDISPATLHLPTRTSPACSSPPSSSSTPSSPTTPFFVRPPAKYLSAMALNASPPPPPTSWLLRTWSVAYSTLSMWRTACNVRITYSELPAKNNRTRINDTVEYESNRPSYSSPSSSYHSAVKSVAGIDTQSPSAPFSWTWRGRGLLFFVTSHWEILAWGENELPNGEVECWVVTWFAPTVFTQEGIDIYSSRAEGLSEEMYEKILGGLKRMEGRHVSRLVSEQMAPVEIRLPWAKARV